LSEPTSSRASDVAEALDDLIDVLGAAMARAEMRATGEKPIPWEQVKADLGLE